VTTAQSKEREAEALLADMAKEDEDFAEIERLLERTGEGLKKAEAKANEAMEKLKEA
jgi:hypothetical protein